MICEIIKLDKYAEDKSGIGNLDHCVYSYVSTTIVVRENVEKIFEVK